MRTRHLPNAYIGPQPYKPLPPLPPPPIIDIDLPPLAHSGPIDFARFNRPSPKNDGRDPSPKRKSREDRNIRPGKVRPATIVELADKSREDLPNLNKNIQYWLHAVTLASKSGKHYSENGDYERSYVQYARVACIIREKIPIQREYHTLLTNEQRCSLTLVILSFSRSLSFPVSCAFSFDGGPPNVSPDRTLYLP